MRLGSIFLARITTINSCVFFKFLHTMSIYIEDKKCRMCGYADLKNVNIFGGQNKGLAKKLRIVFPILLYEQDPLPKHICKKCTATVGFMFVDIQRVMKMQKQWIENVRFNQPDNNYICILDMIESANRVTKQSIKTILHEEVSPESIERLTVVFEGTNENDIKKNNTFSSKPVATEISSKPLYKHNFMPIHIKTEPKTEVPKKDKKFKYFNGSSSLDDKETKQEQLVQPQKKRAAAVAAAVACTTLLFEREPKARKLNSSVQIRTDLDNNNICVKKNTLKQLKPSTKNIVVKSTNKPTTATTATTITNVEQNLLKNVPCPLCTLSFPTANELAAHQVLHLRLQLPKIFARKCLPKRERKGRLLNLSDKQCIRCLNCWRIFEDNKSILLHWSQYDCGFYCQICGKEFAHAPKMLREHVPAAHGVSYRTTKFLCSKYATPLVESSVQKTETITDYLTTMKARQVKQDAIRLTKVKRSSPQKRAACSICGIWFQNMKARNSHMRKHKQKLTNIAEEVNTKTANECQQNSIIDSATTTTTTTACDISATKIKTEPLDMNEKCQVCHNILTGGLEEHVCF